MSDPCELELAPAALLEEAPVSELAAAPATLFEEVATALPETHGVLLAPADRPFGWTFDASMMEKLTPESMAFYFPPPAPRQTADPGGEWQQQKWRRGRTKPPAVAVLPWTCPQTAAEPAKGLVTRA